MTAAGDGARNGFVHLRAERTRAGAFIETVHSDTGTVKDSVFLTAREVGWLIGQLVTLSPFSQDYAYPGALRNSMHIPSAIERRAADAARGALANAPAPPQDPPQDPPEDPGGGAGSGEL